MPPTEQDKLSQILRECRPAPGIPPGFQEAVWRRIERAEAGAGPSVLPGWLARLASWASGPQFALASVGVMLVLGTVLGLMDGRALTMKMAQERYLAAVSPLTVRH